MPVFSRILYLPCAKFPFFVRAAVPFAGRARPVSSFIGVTPPTYWSMRSSAPSSRERLARETWAAPFVVNFAPPFTVTGRLIDSPS